MLFFLCILKLTLLCKDCTKLCHWNCVSGLCAWLIRLMHNQRMWGLCRHRSPLWCACPRMQVPSIFLSMKICQSWLSTTHCIRISLKGLWDECCCCLSSFSLYPLVFTFPSTSTVPFISSAAVWDLRCFVCSYLSALLGTSNGTAREFDIVRSSGVDVFKGALQIALFACVA